MTQLARLGRGLEGVGRPVALLVQARGFGIEVRGALVASEDRPTAGQRVRRVGREEAEVDVHRGARRRRGDLLAIVAHHVFQRVHALGRGRPRHRVLLRGVLSLDQRVERSAGGGFLRRRRGQFGHRRIALALREPEAERDVGALPQAASVGLQRAVLVGLREFLEARLARRPVDEAEVAP